MRSLLLIAVLIGCVSLARACPRGPLLMCQPPTVRVHVGDDARGCPRYACEDAVACNATTGPRCPPGARSVQTGVDANGCSVVACLPQCAPVHCPFKTHQIQIGIDGTGCPSYTCVPWFCPMISCPPFAKVSRIYKGLFGCLIVECAAASRCPPAPCGPLQSQTELGKDYYGCPVYKCANCPIPRIGCSPPNQLVPREKPAPGKCPQVACKTPEEMNCPKVDCPATSVQRSVAFNRDGCPIMNCVPCPVPRIFCAPPSELKPQGNAPPGQCPSFACSAP